MTSRVPCQTKLCHQLKLSPFFLPVPLHLHLQCQEREIYLQLLKLPRMAELQQRNLSKVGQDRMGQIWNPKLDTTDGDCQKGRGFHPAGNSCSAGIVGRLSASRAALTSCCHCQGTILFCQHLHTFFFFFNYSLHKNRKELLPHWKQKGAQEGSWVQISECWVCGRGICILKAQTHLCQTHTTTSLVGLKKERKLPHAAS